MHEGSELFPRQLLLELLEAGVADAARCLRGERVLEHGHAQAQGEAPRSAPETLAHCEEFSAAETLGTNLF